MTLRRTVLTLLAWLVLSGAARSAPFADRVDPVARWSLEPRAIRVMRAFEPSFPAIEEPQWEQAKRELSALFHRLFRLEIRIEDAGMERPVSFLRRNGVDLRSPSGGLLDHLVPGGRREPFISRIAESIAGQRPEQIRAYLPPGLSCGDRPAELAEAIVQTFERRSRQIVAAAERSLGGLAAECLTMITMGAWSRAMRAQHEVDLVVTNVPLVYGEVDGTALHALVRGGLIGGFCTWGGGGPRHDGVCVVTVFPLVSRAQAVAEIGGERLEGRHQGLTVASLAGHELVHLFFRLGDNYSHRRCLMHPPPGVDYHRFWHVQDPLLFCDPCNRQARARDAGRRATALERSGRLESALAARRAVTDLAPEDADALNDAAWSCLVRGYGVDEALTWARKARQIAPRSAAIADTVGWGEFVNGDDEAALATLRAAVDLPGASVGEITFHLGVAAMASGEVREGAATLQRAVAHVKPDTVAEWVGQVCVAMLVRVFGRGRFF